MATRSELFQRLGILKPVVKPILEAIFEIEEDEIWRKDLFSSPHGEKWHTSFHASSFPGDDYKACGRKAIYELMNIPDNKPLKAEVRLMGEVGKAVEDEIVWRFHRAGLLISNPPSEEFQTTFVDQEHWLSCSPDSIIVRPKEKKPHPIEIKGKDPKVVQEMQHGLRSYDPPHRNQLMTQLGLTVENQLEEWPDLEPATHGTILYIDRARPGTTHEYKFKYSPDFMQQGRAKLTEWKEAYLKEFLPPRPKDWKWTEHPCQWCKFKPMCKEDNKQKIDNLRESTTIDHAKVVRGKYDYEGERQEVIERWDD